MFRYKVVKKCFKKGRLYEPNRPGKDVFESEEKDDCPHLELIEEVKATKTRKTRKPQAPKGPPPMPAEVQGVKMKTQDVEFKE